MHKEKAVTQIDLDVKSFFGPTRVRMSKDSEDFKIKFQTGAQVLQKLFESGKSPLSDQFLRWKLWAQWEQIVGSQMAGVCEPVGLSRGILKIWVKNSSWNHQLQFFREEILKKIQKVESFSHVTSLIFTLDRKSVPQEEEAKQELKNQTRRLRKFHPQDE